jgi:hypothetical protein
VREILSVFYLEEKCVQFRSTLVPRKGGVAVAQLDRSTKATKVLKAVPATPYWTTLLGIFNRVFSLNFSSTVVMFLVLLHGVLNETNVL